MVVTVLHFCLRWVRVLSHSPSETGARMPDHSQFTQEIRLATNELGQWDYQIGAFFFSEDLTIENLSFDTLANGAQNGISRQEMETTAWAIFGSTDYENGRTYDHHRWYSLLKR